MCGKIIIVLLLCFWGVSCNTVTQNSVVLIAFDGFRYDYFKRGLTPVLDRLRQVGSSTKFMLNQFPTITFPNFFSISTGLYPETHGVLGNLMFNKQGKCITYGYEMFHYNEEIIPIWMLNEHTGGQRHSGVMMWPSSQFSYQGKYPTFMVPFNQSISWISRVDTAINWLRNEKTPANLVLIYFEEPDETGHRYGPDSPELDQQLRKINAIMKYYLRKLKSFGIRDKINTVIVSDHGMTAINRTTITNLNFYVDPAKYDGCGSSPGFQIQPHKGFEEEIYNNLTKVSNKLKRFAVYKRKDMPDRWHLKNNELNADIFVEAKLHNIFADAADKRGTHGYDNKEAEMHPIFIAHGPEFKRNFTTKPFQNIDIYPLISHILGLPSLPPNVTPNGTLTDIQDILKNKNEIYRYEILPK